jgi:hypothetical protein
MIYLNTSTVKDYKWGNQLDASSHPNPLAPSPSFVFKMDMKYKGCVFLIAA